MLRRNFLIAMLATLIGRPVKSAPRTNRLAIVIGNSAYEPGAELPNAGNDAEAVAAAFRRLGYAVVLEENVSRSDMMRLLARADELPAEIDQIVFYFAGHGVQVGDEMILLMTDTQLTSDRWMGGALPLRVVVAALSRQPRQKIIILDACRENPLTGKLRDLPAPAHFKATAGMYLAFSSQPGAPAFEGTEALSPFAASFVDALRDDAKSVEEVFRQVRVQVLKKTAGAQIPWTRSSLLRRATFGR